jgi:hypothetical protein
MSVVPMVSSHRGATNGPWCRQAGGTLARGIALASAFALAAGAQLPRAPR